MTQLRSHPRLVRKLQDALGDQLCVALDDPTVVEIMLNPDGKLFIERLGHGIAPAGEMTAATAEIVIGSVAHALNSEADDEQPIISGELPIGGHRFEGLLPPVVGGPTFTIRRRASRLIPLADYVSGRVMTAAQADIIRNAVASKLNIVISGGTGSGKTTLANAVIAEIADAAPDGYTPFGSIIRGVGYGNNEQLWLSQDTSERPTQLIGQNDGDGSTNLLVLYAFGDQMNLTSIDDQMLDYLDQSFTYDAAGRLTGTTRTENDSPVVYSWTYDLVGNRASETVKVGTAAATTSTYAYGTDNNRLASISVGGTNQRTFTYGANGATASDVETVSSVIRTFGYDPLGRLLQVSEGGAVVGQYAYDGLSRLSSRTIETGGASSKVLSVAMLGEGGQLSELMPNAGEAFSGLGNRIIAEADASGVTKREYIWAGNIAVGVIDAADTASPSLYFVQNDHIGRPVRMRDGSQNTVWWAHYRPFGEATTAGSATLDLRLPGQWFQMETGLSWNWHRTYDPSLGRYLQPDPLGLTDGPSVYGYAHQSPLMGIDPEGTYGALKIVRACLMAWSMICQNPAFEPPDVEEIPQPPIEEPGCIDTSKVRRKDDPK